MCVTGCLQVVGGVPYVMNDEYIKHIIEVYRVDYIVHGAALLRQPRPRGD